MLTISCKGMLYTYFPYRKKFNEIDAVLVYAIIDKNVQLLWQMIKIECREAQSIEGSHQVSISIEQYALQHTINSLISVLVDIKTILFRRDVVIEKITMDDLESGSMDPFYVSEAPTSYVVVSNHHSLCQTIQLDENGCSLKPKFMKMTTINNYHD